MYSSLPLLKYLATRVSQDKDHLAILALVRTSTNLLERPRVFRHLSDLAC